MIAKECWVKQAVQVMVRLTGREAEVLRLIARGCTYVQALGGGGGDARRGTPHFLRMKKRETR